MLKFITSFLTCCALCACSGSDSNTAITPPINCTMNVSGNSITNVSQSVCDYTITATGSNISIDSAAFVDELIIDGSNNLIRFSNSSNIMVITVNGNDNILQCTGCQFLTIDNDNGLGNGTIINQLIIL